MKTSDDLKKGMVKKSSVALSKALDKPLVMQNVKVIMRKLQAEMSKILAEYEQGMNDDDAKTKMKGFIIKSLDQAYNDFDINLFNLNMTPDKTGRTIILEPQNFITALWMQGVQVTTKEIEGKDVYYDGEIATYGWNDDTKQLGVKTNMRMDLLEDE